MIKILYAVQATGNGPITRAVEILKHLEGKAAIEILVSGNQASLEIPFKVKYRIKGLSLFNGKKGGVNLWKTYWKMNSLKIIKDIKSLKVNKYDLVINDFEPISSWACIKEKKTCIGLSNQVATLHPDAPRPLNEDILGKLILENYAPSTFSFGFHFKSLGPNIFTPIIREEIRALETSNKGHYTVYLSAYDDKKIYEVLSMFQYIEWQVFSIHVTKVHTRNNVVFIPVNDELFQESIANCAGVLCHAGFGTCSETLFLKKKLLVIPIKTQIEQHYNAAMLESMGVPIMKKLSNKYLSILEAWIEDDFIVPVDYPDQTAEIIDTILDKYGNTIE